MILLVLAGEPLSSSIPVRDYVRYFFGCWDGFVRCEYLVTGVAAAMLAAAGGLSLYFYGSWGAMIQDFGWQPDRSSNSAPCEFMKIGFPEGESQSIQGIFSDIVEQMLHSSRLTFSVGSPIVPPNMLFMSPIRKTAT